MAEVQLAIGGHHYMLSCADGEEDDLRVLADVVHQQIVSARLMAGGLSEARQLLFASILLAEQLVAAKSGAAAGTAVAGGNSVDTALAGQIDAAALRVEALASRIAAALAQSAD